MEKRLKCDDPRVVKKYLKTYDEFLVKNSLYKRVSILERQVKAGQMLSVELIKEYEAIDKCRVKGMEQAEATCRKLKVGYQDWSPELQVALETHRYWYQVLLRLSGCKISARRLSRMAKSLKILRPELTKAELQEKERISKQEYEAKKKKSTSLRGTWLHDLALARAEAGLVYAAKAVQVMQRQEKMRKDHRIIRSVKKESQKRTLTHVQSTIEGALKTHTTKEEIEKAGLKEFEERPRQANDTPLQTEAAIQLLGLTG